MTDEWKKSHAADKAKYIAQWSDSTMPITQEESCAYDAGYQDGYMAKAADTGWREISTPPKDTTQGDFLVGRFNSQGDLCWVKIVRNPVYIPKMMAQPTHFMWVPPPPVNPNMGEVK